MSTSNGVRVGDPEFVNIVEDLLDSDSEDETELKNTKREKPSTLAPKNNPSHSNDSDSELETEEKVEGSKTDKTGALDVDVDTDSEDESGFYQTSSKLNKQQHLSAVEKNRGKRFDFLLKQTELYSHFMRSAYRDAIDSVKSQGSTEEDTANSPVAGSSKGSQKKTGEKSSRVPSFTFSSSPDFIKGGEMRDYQIRGLNWLISLHENGLSGILADEMGLGKTIQTISLLGYLRHYRKVKGPHLVIAPKTTLPTWMNEIRKWCPSLKAECLIGLQDERASIIHKMLRTSKWNVCVTSYDVVLREMYFLKKFNWAYLIIDEAHRIKNENAILSKCVRLLRTKNRLLLTGTPLHNNLHELWALLNFLIPDVFNSSEDFDSWFDTYNCLGDDTLVTRLQSVLRPFLLRRIKADVEKSLPPKKELKVYVGLTEMQREWYKKVLLNDLQVFRDGQYFQKNLSNILMHLRKVCIHPYLFPGAEPGPPYELGNHLVENSGKMIVLDKLLPKLEAEGSRVLLFSQMTRMLDILEDYCFMRKIKYTRLDGDTDLEERYKNMVEFNKKDSTTFLYLLSTRAGGLGITLTGADVVILYDSDWNPQMDIQAMDRCHRIGQTKEVRVFRLITENSVDEKVDERAEVKRHLDRLVIQQGRMVDSLKLQKHEKLNIINYGVEKIFATKGAGLSDENIDYILAQSKERTDKMAEQFANLDEKGLKEFTLDVPTNPEVDINAILSNRGGSLFQFEGQDYRALRKSTIGKKFKFDDDENTTTRLGEDRRSSRNVRDRKESWADSTIDGDSEYLPPGAENTISSDDDDPLNPTEFTEKKSPEPSKIKVMKRTHFDFQFPSPRLVELWMKEKDYYEKNSGTGVGLIDDIPLTEALEIQTLEQKRIQECQPLSRKEIVEKKSLKAEMNFRDWQVGHFKRFLVSVNRYGFNDLELISRSIIGIKERQRMSQEKVVAFHQVFLKRCYEVFDLENEITDGDLLSQLLKLKLKLKQCLDFKISLYTNPKEDLEVCYGSLSESGDRFKPSDDRDLILAMQEIELESKDWYHELYKAIRLSAQYSSFLRTRTVKELHYRCYYLLNLIKEEVSSSNPQSQEPGCSMELDSLNLEDIPKDPDTPDSKPKKSSKKKSKVNTLCHKTEEDVLAIATRIVGNSKASLRPVLSPLRLNKSIDDLEDAMEPLFSTGAGVKRKSSDHFGANEGSKKHKPKKLRLLNSETEEGQSRDSSCCSQESQESYVSLERLSPTVLASYARKPNVDNMDKISKSKKKQKTSSQKTGRREKLTKP